MDCIKTGKVNDSASSAGVPGTFLIGREPVLLNSHSQRMLKILVGENKLVKSHFLS